MAGGKVVFEGFERLSGNVWLLDKLVKSKRSKVETDNGTTAQAAAATANGSRNSQPDLVILATWMSADARHIKKYITGYRELFPRSSFLLIRNDIADVTFRPRSVILHRIQPALTALERTIAAHRAYSSSSSSTGSSISHNDKSYALSSASSSTSLSTSSSALASSTTSPRPPANILLHMFSNGGANQARILAQLWHDKYGQPLPISAMLLDSCPGIESYRTMLSAFIIALPKFFLLRYLLLSVIHVVFIAHFIANRVFGAVSFLRRLRNDLNDASLFPQAAPRVYIYSKTDDMVDWRDVETHAEDARSKGWDVTTDRFHKSKHVGHLIVDNKRYWDHVQSLV